ncbi:MAG TPA: hypothetical protein V6C72_07070, partial [Chroococcales cyanobacterium]
MEKPELYRKRIANYLANVIAPAIYEDSEPLKVWAFQCADPIAYDEAITREFQPVDIGFRFGPKWSTVWFKVEGTVPERFQDRKVLLRFNCETEALLYRHGEPMQGMELNHDDHLLFRQGKSGDFVSMFIECGVNLLMGADGGSRYDSREPTSGPHAPAALKRCQLAVLNDTVRGLYYDISFLANL